MLAFHVGRAALVALCCLLWLDYHVASASVSPPIDNRLLTASTESGSVVVLFSCTSDRNPVSDPNSLVNRLCYVQCFDTACNLYQIGSFDPPNLVNARMLAFGISPQNGELALLYSSEMGLYLWICSDMDCSIQRSRELRAWNSTNPGTTLGNSLALTKQNSWAVVFIEPTSTIIPTYQTVLVTCSVNYCDSQNETILKSWNSIGTPSISPTFLRTDNYGRYIIGFQSFRGNTSYFMEVWRCDATLNCTQQGNSTLDKPLTSITVTPSPTTPANRGVVLLAGTQLSMLSYISGVDYLIQPDPAPVPLAPPSPPPPLFTIQLDPSSPENETSPIEAPTVEPAPQEAPPSISAPQLEQTPPDISPNNDTNSTPSSANPNHGPETGPVDTPRPVSSPPSEFRLESPDESPFSAPVSAPTIPMDPSYWYMSRIHRIGQASGSTVGFQTGLTSVGAVPIFAFSYVQGNAYCRVSRGYCGTPNCRSQVTTILTQSTFMEENAALPHTAISLLPGGNLAIFSHNGQGVLIRTVFSSYSSINPITDGAINTVVVSPQPSPRSNWDVLGIVGIANATIASVIVLISLIVFLIHFSMSRRNDDDMAFWDAQRLTTQQRDTLAAYYKELKAD